MTPVVLIDGKKQSKASVFNRNTQFGDGLFETCLVENKKLLFFPHPRALSARGAARPQILSLSSAFP